MSTVLWSERVQICGITFDDLDLDGVVQAIMDGVSRGRGGWVVTPNVDILRQAVADAELAALIERSTLVVLDGAPLQWAGRIAGNGHLQRAPGASMALPLARAAAEQDVPMLLLGGRPGAGEQAAANLRSVLPTLRVHDHCPDFGFEADPVQWNAVRDSVRQASGGVVLVGLGFPKQERVMDALSVEFPDTWFVGVGGTIDFLAGFVPRAPEWVQDAGFEWVYRLAVEPKRLARRYLVEGLPFAWQLMVWAARERRRVAAAERGRRRWEPGVTAVQASMPLPQVAGPAPRALPSGDRSDVTLLPNVAAPEGSERLDQNAEVLDLRRHRAERASRSDEELSGPADPSAGAHVQVGLRAEPTPRSGRDDRSADADTGS